jgi:hypothetical protein
MFRRLVFSIETQADAAPLASHWRFKLDSCFQSVQASKPAWLWDPEDLRGRFEIRELCPFHGHEDAWTLRKPRDCCEGVFRPGQ